MYSLKIEGFETEEQVVVFAKRIIDMLTNTVFTLNTVEGQVGVGFDGMDFDHSTDYDYDKFMDICVYPLEDNE